LQLECAGCGLFPVKRGLIRAKRVCSLGPLGAEPPGVRGVDVVGGVDPRKLEIC
jgi:hypothetical protein